mmetsp:Transcript_2044/g.4568  ORF Transcript_2044/g.4568 Transcript_2044/m.4568 type:complete len:275 (+) Transcript_2044:1060-1884(+)
MVSDSGAADHTGQRIATAVFTDGPMNGRDIYFSSAFVVRSRRCEQSQCHSVNPTVDNQSLVKEKMELQSVSRCMCIPPHPHAHAIHKSLTLCPFLLLFLSHRLVRLALLSHTITCIPTSTTGSFISVHHIRNIRWLLFMFIDSRCGGFTLALVWSWAAECGGGLGAGGGRRGGRDDQASALDRQPVGQLPVAAIDFQELFVLGFIDLQLQRLLRVAVVGCHVQPRTVSRHLDKPVVLADLAPLLEYELLALGPPPIAPSRLGSVREEILRPRHR